MSKPELSESSEVLSGGKFAAVLGIACLLLVSGVATMAAWDSSQRNLIESSELAVMPEEEVFFLPPAELKTGMPIASMDRRVLSLAKVGAVSHPADKVLAVGMEDKRIYPIYQLRVPPEEGPNYLLLKISPDTFLEVSDR